MILPRLAVCAAFCFALPVSAQASSFSLRSGQGTEGLGLSYAGGASGGIGLPSIAWNPATITMFPGRTSNWNFTYILPQADYKVLSTNAPAFGVPVRGTGDIALDGAFVPASYSAWQLNDQIWIGLSTGAPWGLRSKPENQIYSGQIYGRSSTVRSMNVAPTIGYKVNDWLSLGAALQIQSFKADLKQALPVPALGYPNTILRGDNVSWGYRLGATLTPWQGGTIGLGYRSSIHHKLEGEFVTPITLPGTPLVRGDNPITAKLNLPDSVTFGLSQQINAQWQVHLGAEWTNWSRFRRIPVVAQNGSIPFTSLNFEYRDSWYFSSGVEYVFNKDLTLRAGLAYELSAVTDRVRTVRISDNDRLWLSAGIGYQLTEQLKLDVSYAHIFVKKAPVNIGPGHPEYRPTANPVTLTSFYAEAKPSIDIVSASLTYRWDNPAKTVGVLDNIVRK
jgi:long-chain fatty acid transport protein